MADKNQKSSVQEVKVSARGIRISPRKVRLVAGLLNSLPVYNAQDQLKFSVKKAALSVSKLLDSGIAAAQNDHKIEPERLFIKSLTVDAGPFFKRYKPRAQGRAFPIRRRTSYINLVLGVSDKPLTEKREAVSKPKKKREAAPVKPLDPKAMSQKAPTEKKADDIKKELSDASAQEDKGKKSWFNFFRKKKQRGGHGSSKEDLKGKKQQQTFDRRGNM